MKKLLIASLLLLAAPTLVVAQRNLSNNPQSGPRFRSNASENSGIGVKGGVNFTAIKGDGIKKSYADVKGLTLFHFGAYAQIGITNWFSVQPEILYQRKGFESSGDTTYYRRVANPNAVPPVLDSSSTTISGPSKVKVSYLSVPVMLVFNVIEKVSIQVGPQFSYLLNVHPDGRTIDASSNNYNSVDIGLVGGVEAKIEFVRVGARYDYSLTDLRKAGSYSPKFNTYNRAQADIRNGAFQVYVGVGL